MAQESFTCGYTRVYKKDENKNALIRDDAGNYYYAIEYQRSLLDGTIFYTYDWLIDLKTKSKEEAIESYNQRTQSGLVHPYSPWNRHPSTVFPGA
jgi:hypothetical protein